MRPQVYESVSEQRSEPNSMVQDIFDTEIRTVDRIKSSQRAYAHRVEDHESNHHFED